MSTATHHVESPDLRIVQQTLEHWLKLTYDKMGGRLRRETASDLVVGILDAERTINRDTVPPEAREEMVQIAPQLLGIGFDLGVALAASIMQSPLEDPRDRWKSAMAEARRDIKYVVDEAIDVAEVVRNRSSNASGERADAFETADMQDRMFSVAAARAWLQSTAPDGIGKTVDA